jgi:hypothetical protein
VTEVEDLEVAAPADDGDGTDDHDRQWSMLYNFLICHLRSQKIGASIFNLAKTSAIRAIMRP